MTTIARCIEALSTPTVATAARQAGRATERVFQPLSTPSMTPKGVGGGPLRPQPRRTAGEVSRYSQT